MSYSDLPSDVKELIARYVRPEKFTPEGVKLCARRVLVLRGRMEVLKRIYDLVVKYSMYNSHAEHPERFWRRTRLNPGELDLKLDGSPQLFAALSRGRFLFDEDFKKFQYSPEFENDIKSIVELIPESVNFLFGDSNVDSCIQTPLGMACIHEKIPLYIVEFLLQNGAKADVPCKGVRKKVHVLDHLEVGGVRRAALKLIFPKNSI